MSESKAVKKKDKSAVAEEVMFTCKICGETKPLIDLVLMREYFPPLSACKICAVKNKTKEEEEENSQ